MREREELDPGFARDQRRLARRRVIRLARPVALVGEERRLVDEEVGARGCLDDGRRGSGVACEHDRPAGTRLAEHVRGA